MTTRIRHERHRRPPIRSLLALLPAAIALAACGGGDDGGTASSAPSSGATAVVTTVASDYSSGQVQLIDLTADTLMASEGYFPTISDIVVDTNANDYYLIERAQADRIGKIDLGTPSEKEWEYAAIGGGEQGSANPYQLVLASDSKAYLLRYGKETAWIVDPSATSEENFKTGELDLSAYTASGAPAPRMSAGTIVNGKLFVTLQRLDGSFQPSNTSCVAVFDVETDQAVEADQDPDCGDGIPLNGRNPGEILFQQDVGLLVQNTGAYDPDYSISGIDVIDPDDYSVETLVQADADTGLISNIAVLDADTGFFLGYDAFGSIDLRAFNPTSGEVASSAIANLEAQDLRDVTIGPESGLWVANAESGNPRVVLVDPTNGTVTTSVATDLPPAGIDFSNLD